ncbi:hypothetical protein SATMO3_53110 [Sporomusa aerivorans]
MQEYDSKDALLAAIQTAYERFDKEFDDVPEEKLNLRIKEVDRTPQEMIAYQLGWLTLIMGWEDDELNGKTVVTPAPGCKWNQLGLLYQRFYEEYGGYSLSQLRLLFKQRTEAWCAWISGLSDEELFTPNVRQWTVTSAHWPMWKWLHINSVAPFKNFRTKLRKWKKHAGNAG